MRSDLFPLQKCFSSGWRASLKLAVNLSLIGLSWVWLSACASQEKTPELSEDDPQSESGLPSEVRDRFQVREGVVDVNKEAREKNAPPPKGPAPQDEKKSTQAQKNTPPPQPAKPTFQWPQRRKDPTPVWVGEEWVFDVTYFGMVAGQVTIRVEPFKYIRNRKVFHILGRAKTSRVFNVFYWLDDMAETYWDYEGLFSHRYRIFLNEKKQKKDTIEIYDSEKQKTYYWDRWDRFDKGYHERKEWYDIEPFPQDQLSAVYYIRTLPLKDGVTYRFPLVAEGKSYELLVNAERREKIRTPLGRVPVVVVRVDTKFEGIMKKRGYVYAWYTDDDRRILVRVEAKVKVGAVVGKLVKVKLGEKPK